MRPQAIVERLEFVSKRVPNLKFTLPQQLKGDDQGCFMSCDMFYIEIKLDRTWTVVKDVVISHGDNQEIISCTILKKVLSDQDYETFAKHLLGLHSIYQINTVDPILKQRAYPVLSALEQDLNILSSYQRNSMSNCHNLVHRSPIGVMEPRQGGLPVRLYYFVAPLDLVDPVNRKFIDLTIPDIIDKNLGLSVTVEIEGSASPESSCRLQNRSLLAGFMNSKNLPSYPQLDQSNSEELPAQFVLKLSQSMPLSISLIHKLIEIATMLQEPASIIEYFSSLVYSKETLISLIAKQSQLASKSIASNRSYESYKNIHDNDCDDKKQTYNIKLKDEHQTYCFEDFQLDGRGGVIVEKIPFSHPAMIPKILTILRKQALFNSVIESCIRQAKSKTNLSITNGYKTDDEISTMFEVTLTDLTSVFVSFENPLDESLATLEVDLKDINELKCKLYAKNMSNMCSIAFASKIIQQCWSIPITLRSILKKCNETKAALIEEANKKLKKEMQDLLDSKNSRADLFAKKESFSNISTPMICDDIADSSSGTDVRNHNNSIFKDNATKLNQNISKQLKESSQDQDSKSSLIRKYSCQPHVDNTIKTATNAAPDLKKVINKVNNKEAQRKASLSKQSNTILMSMLSDVPAGVESTTGPKGIKRSRSNVSKKTTQSTTNQDGSKISLDLGLASKQHMEHQSKIPRIDQFAIKQGSSGGLKLTVKKKLSTTNSVATPPVESSKLFNNSPSGIKYKIPKISKTQQQQSQQQQPQQPQQQQQHPQQKPTIQLQKQSQQTSLQKQPLIQVQQQQLGSQFQSAHQKHQQQQQSNQIPKLQQPAQIPHLQQTQISQVQQQQTQMPQVPQQVTQIPRMQQQHPQQQMMFQQVQQMQQLQQVQQMQQLQQVQQMQQLQQAQQLQQRKQPLQPQVQVQAPQSISTPSSPTDSFHVESLPPPPMIPIDTLDDGRVRKDEDDDEQQHMRLQIASPECDQQLQQQQQQHQQQVDSSH